MLNDLPTESHSIVATHSHIVAIRQGGVVQGHQLRINGGGAGRSRFFAAGKYGSPEKARRAAETLAREMGLPKAQSRGGSETGRVQHASATRTAGIRFEWTQRLNGPVLRVVATWTDQLGRLRHTSYSVERNGLDGALDKAIAARTSAGAPQPARAALLKLLRREYATRGL
jgi:hypothetical protein